MSKLLIGESSQLANYINNNNIIKISSRNIQSEIFENYWDKVYILFAEQRTIFSKDKNYKNFFYNINVDYTLDVVNKLKSSNIVFLSTTELWNRCVGPISLNTPWYYSENYYTDSKRIITEKLQQRENVKICYPFNFNSIYRKKDFLFGKIYESLKCKKKIKVGNLNLTRELLHAKFVANKIIECEKDELIGTGTPINILNFIKDLYDENQLNFDELVEHCSNEQATESYYSSAVQDYSYKQRLKDYSYDLRDFTN